MYYVIGTINQMEELSRTFKDCLPTQICEQMKMRIETLELYYGSDRDPEADMGGYVVLFPSMSQHEMRERRNILEKYHVKENEYEYQDVILTEGGQKWMEELYMVGADFGIIILSPFMVNEGGAYSD